MVLQDRLQRSIQLHGVPKRIVSLVPSQTELLCDLGLEQSIVGVTKFCVHPNHLIKEKTIVGGTKQVHLDRIKALQPDIILCNKEENTQEIVEACKAITAVHVSDIFTINDTLELVSMYGDMFSVKEKATAISHAIQVEATSFKEWVQDKPVKNVVYFIWKKPWMVAANNTFINYLLSINNFKNSFGDLSRYPEITLDNEDVTVDYVLLSSEPYPFKEKHKKDLKNFFPNAKICLVDGEMFSWYGSRLIKAFRYFKTLHQDYLH